MLFARIPRPRARRTLAAHARAAGAAAVRPPAGERFLAFGPDPLRVLLLGGGNAVGYGVETRAAALDGRLGARIAEATGRGVIVNNVADAESTLAQQLARAAVSVEFGDFDVVVWCPSFAEMAGRRPAREWHRRLHGLLGSAPSATVLVLELPEPVGDDPTVRTAVERIARMNHDLRATVARLPGAVIVAPPPVTVRAFGRPLFDAAYYDALGRRLFEALRPARQISTSTPIVTVL